jgi:hypothetical protein
MRGPPPGLIAFAGEFKRHSSSRLGEARPPAIGWCQLTPRDAVLWLDRTLRLRRVDDLPVWSLSCFYVRIGYRRQGVVTGVTHAALRAAKHGRAPALEVYPFDAGISPSATGTGYVSTFLHAGFTIAACRAPPRPIMRHNLAGIGEWGLGVGS